MSTEQKNLPTYAELLERRDAPPGSAWGLFGENDHIGTINLLSRETALRGCSLVRRGQVFNLDYQLNAFRPPTSPFRKELEHTVVTRYDGHVLDDFVNNFFLQGSSQIDGLRHHSHRPHGFYNNVPAESIRAGSQALGVQHVAQKGIVGRGVLLDVERFLAGKGKSLDLWEPTAISLEDLKETARSQGVTFETGDILLMHTGWARRYLEELTPGEQAGLIEERKFCGVEQSREMLAWIWDHHFSVVASDTAAVEVMPSASHSPFEGNVRKMMHPDLIALLGVCLGELWRLDELADSCAADGVYEFMVVAKPLNLTGGVGSPPNAMAIK